MAKIARGESGEMILFFSVRLLVYIGKVFACTCHYFGTTFSPLISNNLFSVIKISVSGTAVYMTIVQINWTSIICNVETTIPRILCNSSKKFQRYYEREKKIIEKQLEQFRKYTD